MKIESPTPEQIKATRKSAGLTQSECGEMFGYAERTWRGKEAAGSGNRGLTIGEYAYLLLLAGRHPMFSLEPKTKP